MVTINQRARLQWAAESIFWSKPLFSQKSTFWSLVQWFSITSLYPGITGPPVGRIWLLLSSTVLFLRPFCHKSSDPESYIFFSSNSLNWSKTFLKSRFRRSSSSILLLVFRQQICSLVSTILHGTLQQNIGLGISEKKSNNQWCSSQMATFAFSDVSWDLIKSPFLPFF